MIGAIALGGLGGVDRAAFGQTMFAHPVVCGTLAGWVAGDPLNGLRLGIVFGMFASRRAPIGGAGPVLDWTSAAICVPFALGASAAGWQWGLGLVVGLVVALLGGRSILGLRGLAASGEVVALSAASDGDPAPLERFHLRMIGLHILRGAATVLLATLALSSLAFDIRWSLPEQSAAAMVWGLAPLSAAVVLVHAHLRHAGWRWVGLGVVASGLLILLAGAAA
ncbi:hypothetical protein DRQ53_00185 [bacterium]|nr:MAG: hypothetical protein DRQ53_00185 [bacterium]